MRIRTLTTRPAFRLLHHTALLSFVLGFTCLGMLLVPMLLLSGCEPTEGELLMQVAEDEGIDPDELDEGDLESQSYAITGDGLPSGCNGGEQRHTISYPVDRERDGSHLRIIFRLPPENWCWISVHGRVNTDWAQGGADNWTAVLRRGYYANGDDKLEVMVPKTFWWGRYSWYRWGVGFSSSVSYTQVANLFWVWAYE